MESDLTSFLLNNTRHAQISPEKLELLGKEAANLLLDKGVSLNESIAKLASAHDDITHEQVKRICEFANTQVYLAQHDQNKTAGAATSYPQFELADPNRVIQDLSDGARPTVLSPVDVSYGQQPSKKEKVSSAFVTEKLAEMFGISQAQEEKDYSRDTAVHEIVSTKDALQGLRDSLTHSEEEFDLTKKEASAAYYERVRGHLLDGGSFVDVVVSANTAGVSNDKIAAVVTPLVERLLEEKVATASELSDDVKSLSKVACRIVNEDHPFVTGFKELVSLNDELSKCAAALTGVDEQLEAINTFIRENFLAGTAS